MMWRTAGLMLIVLVLAVPAPAQMWRQPADAPVTADGKDWYRSGEPLLIEGHLYYPAGATTHFNANEMVRSGYLDAVPIYSRTTYEPKSIIYVPLSGGLVRPYERRRDGDLAGTVGSTPPGFPVTLPAADPLRAAPPLRAAGPPTGQVVGMWGTRTERREAMAERQFVHDAPLRGTTGVSARAVPGRLSTARPPEGLNAAFINFQQARWFLAGPAVLVDPGRLLPAGDYFGFPVYRDPARTGTVYVPVVEGAPGLLTPYAAR